MVVAAPRPVEASIDQARERLFRLIDQLKQKYPSLRDRSEYGIGTLEEGGTTVYRERFEAGTTYLIVAVGCDTAQDIDLAVVDENGKLVTKDTADDPAAGVVLQPPYTGTYIVGVNMARTTSGDAAHYAYQVFYVETER
jgi:hypothetical protein